jgi:integration host factor subunit beta
VNKSDLIVILADQSKINTKMAERVVHLFFETITNGLENDERSELRGFGSFAVRGYRAYMGRNPKSGQAIEVNSKKMPVFRPGKDLRYLVNGEPLPGGHYDFSEVDDLTDDDDFK